MIPVEDGTTLPLLYHLNSEPWMNLEAYAQHSYEVEFKQETGEAVALPTPGEGSQLVRLLAARAPTSSGGFGSAVVAGGERRHLGHPARR